MSLFNIIFLILCFVSGFTILFLIMKNRDINDDLYSEKDRSDNLSQALEMRKHDLEKAETQLTAAREDVNDILKEATVYETKFHELSKKFGEEVISNEALKEEVIKWKEEAGKSLSQRKSSEVRVGKIAEHFAPLEKTFPYPIDTAVFFGMPIDIISFDIDSENPGIHFVEVKSGCADLSSKQRRIRDLIEEGKVSFEVFRINPTE